MYKIKHEENILMALNKQEHYGNSSVRIFSKR